MLTRKLFIATTCIALTSATLYSQVGIGTTNPDTTLHIRDSVSSAQILLESDSAVAEVRIDGLTPRFEMYRQGARKFRGEWASNQFKMYSSPPDTITILGSQVLFYQPTLNMSENRRVGINMLSFGEPTEALDVNGRIRLGFSADTAMAGTMRWNDATSSFEGFDGNDWRSFTSTEMNDADGDTEITFAESVTDSIVFKANGNGKLAFDGHRITLGKDGNTFVGHESTLTDTEENIGNTMLGWLNGTNLVSGVSNTSVGFWTAHQLTGGDWNTLLGAFAGRNLIEGNSNTLLGYRAGYNNDGSGNVMIGYRAGELEEGSNKLYIANSATELPLIYGDFNAEQLTIHGSETVAGSLQVDNDITVSDDLVVSDLARVGKLEVGAIAPTVEFKVGSSSRFYFRYSGVQDRLEIHETGTGDVIRIENGEVYFPQMSGQAMDLAIDANGKLIEQPYEANPRLWQYDIERDGPSRLTGINRVLVDGVQIDSITIRAAKWGSVTDDLELRIYRKLRSSATFISDAIYNVVIPESDLTSAAQDFVVPFAGAAGANVVSFETYNYALSISDSGSQHFIDVTFHLSD